MERPTCSSCGRWAAEKQVTLCKVCGSALQLIRFAGDKRLDRAEFEGLSDQLASVIGRLTVHLGAGVESAPNSSPQQQEVSRASPAAEEPKVVPRIPTPSPRPRRASRRSSLDAGASPGDSRTGAHSSDGRAPKSRRAEPRPRRRRSPSGSDEDSRRSEVTVGDAGGRIRRRISLLSR